MDDGSVEHALTEAAPLIGAQRLTRLAQDRWLLVDERGDEVGIVLDGILPRLVLTADVAPLPSIGRLRACELLLAGDPGSPARGGSRAALDLKRDVAVLLLVLPLAGPARCRGPSTVFRDERRLAQQSRRSLSIHPTSPSAEDLSR